MTIFGNTNMNSCTMYKINFFFTKSKNRKSLTFQVVPRVVFAVVASQCNQRILIPYSQIPNMYEKWHMTMA